MIFAQIAAILALIGLDQFTKYLAVQHLAPVGSMPFIPHIMELRYLENSGMAFSMLSGSRVLLVGLTGVAILALLYWLFFRKPQLRLERICLVLLVAGGVGNLIDRVLNGYVVDFFATTFVNFAVFNVADIYVTVGIFLLAGLYIVQEVKAGKAAKAEKEKQHEDL